MSEQRPSKERVAARVKQAMDWSLHYGFKFGDAYVLAKEVERLREELEELHEAHDTLERERDMLNSDMAWIRRRTQFWGEVPPAVGTSQQVPTPPPGEGWDANGSPVNEARR